MCDDFWDLLDALVVCKQLGFPGVLSAVTNNGFGGGAEYGIILDDVICDGSEILLSSCRASNWGIHNCGHSEDAGVVCSTVPNSNERTQIRLTGGSKYEGRLEVSLDMS